MKRRFFLLTLASATLQATDLTAFAEGKPQRRERLKDIEGAPAIEIELLD